MFSFKSFHHEFKTILQEINESIEANDKMIEFFNKYK